MHDIRDQDAISIRLDKILTDQGYAYFYATMRKISTRSNQKETSFVDYTVFSRLRKVLRN